MSILALLLFIAASTICNSESWFDQCNGDVRSANHKERHQDDAMVNGNFADRRTWQACFNCIDSATADVDGHGCSSSTFAVLSTCQCNAIKGAPNRECKCIESLSHYGMMVEVVFAPLLSFIGVILSCFMIVHKKPKRPRGFKRSRRRRRARQARLSPAAYIPRPPPAPRAMPMPMQMQMQPMSPPMIPRARSPPPSSPVQASRRRVQFQ